MYQKLADKQVVIQGTDAYSAGIPLTGANTVQVEWTLFSLSGTTPTLTVSLQESNDLENWGTTLGTVMGTVASLSGPGYASFGYKQIAAQYVRLKYSASAATGSATGVVSAGINTVII